MSYSLDLEEVPRRFLWGKEGEVIHVHTDGPTMQKGEGTDSENSGTRDLNLQTLKKSGTRNLNLQTLKKFGTRNLNLQTVKSLEGGI